MKIKRWVILNEFGDLWTEHMFRNKTKAVFYLADFMAGLCCTDYKHSVIQVTIILPRKKK